MKIKWKRKRVAWGPDLYRGYSGNVPMMVLKESLTGDGVVLSPLFPTPYRYYDAADLVAGMAQGQRLWKVFLKDAELRHAKA